MKKELGQVFTPNNVASMMADMFSLSKESKILDPCFGNGVFIEELLKKGFTSIYGNELDIDLYKNFKNKNIIKKWNKDFLSAKFNVLFDGIIINPPYIRQEEINRMSEYGITKEEIRKNFKKHDIPANANLYSYFLIRALELLRNDGELIAIIPKIWNKSKSGKSLKKIVENYGIVEQEIPLNGSVFGKSVLVDVSIIKIIRKIKPKKSIVKKDILDENHLQIKTIAFVRRGISTGNNKAFIKEIKNKRFNSKYLRNIISSPKGIKSYYTDKANLDNILIVEDDLNKIDKDIKNYLKKIEKNSTKELKKDWYKIKTFDCNGIIFNYFIRNNIKFILNTNKDDLIRDNFYIINSNLYDNRLLFVLLNNLYVYNHLERVGKHYGNGLLKLQKYDIDATPIISPDVIINDDRERLLNLSYEFTFEKVNEVTKILSKYEKKSYEEIKREYNIRKKNRGVSVDERV